MEKALVVILLIILAAGSLNFSGFPSVNFVGGQSNAPVYTQEKTTPGVLVTQSNNLVNSKTLYDIVFKTVAPGVVKNVEVTFPTGSNIANLLLNEISGIGSGLTSISGQKLIYTVTSPITVTAGSTIRLEVGNIINPTVPGNSLIVQVTTKNAAGTIIDNGASTGYAIRQIGASDVADNSITSSKILDGQVGTLDLANNAVTTTKLADNSVSTTQLSSKLADGAVIGSKIADLAITPTKIADGAVIGSKIAPSAITADKLAPNAIRVQITEKRSDKVSIAGGGRQGGAQVFCNAGEIATGGGFIIDDPRVIPYISIGQHDIQGNNRGWIVDASNTDTTGPFPGTSHTIQTTVECLKFIP